MTTILIVQECPHSRQRAPRFRDTGQGLLILIRPRDTRRRLTPNLLPRLHPRHRPWSTPWPPTTVPSTTQSDCRRRHRRRHRRAITAPTSRPSPRRQHLPTNTKCPEPRLPSTNTQIKNIFVYDEDCSRYCDNSDNRKWKQTPTLFLISNEKARSDSEQGHADTANLT